MFKQYKRKICLYSSSKLAGDNVVNSEYSFSKNSQEKFKKN